MNQTQLVLRNLRYHARGNIAVLLGAAVGAAVLTGALLVGDSLRGSLRQRTERQLNGIDTMLVGPRFLRQNLAEELPGQVRGALLLQGTVRSGKSDDEHQHRVGQVNVWGIDTNFGLKHPELSGSDSVAILSANLAQSLAVSVGDTIFVGVQKSSAMPRSSFMSRRGITDATRTFKLTVSSILTDADPANALSLSISPSLPSNIFIPIARLQQEIGQPARINALLGSGESAQSLQLDLAKHLTLEDWGMKVQTPDPAKGYISVESSRLILEPATVAAVEKTAKEMGLRSTETYTYLANSIAYGKQAIPYSIVASLEASQGAPLGPFLPQGVDTLQPGEIALLDWPDSPIKIDPADGDPKITLTYYKPEIEGKIEEASHTFKFRGFVKLAGAADDRHLTPDFPGITDKATLSTWNPPFDIDQSRIKKADEKFWSEHRTTPKAYICLSDGQDLWGTHFGHVTSVRIAPKSGADLEATRLEFGQQLLKNLDPAAGGIVFQPIRERMLAAGGGSTDFGMLFLAFSFFLIVAALMLVGLLFRLNLERRASEVGLLTACGFRMCTVRRLLLVEGIIVASTGSLLGLLGAVIYADAMIRLLVALWPPQAAVSYLGLHVTWQSLAIGFLSAVFMSGLAIYWALRMLSKTAPARLLQGNSAPIAPIKNGQSRRPWLAVVLRYSVLLLAITSFLGAAGLAAFAPHLPPGEAQAGAFFGCGSMLLIGALALLWAWMKRTHHAAVAGHGPMALAKLGARNAVRNPWRSLLTAGLLSSAAFLLVAVESFRREPEKDFLDKKGGSGGFNLLATAATPIDFDLNDEEGLNQIEEGLKRTYQDRGYTSVKRQELVERDMILLQDVEIHRFRMQAGDDASCLNLYQASRPRLLGVPASIIERGGFSFADTLKNESNPWHSILGLPKGPHDPIPCIVEQNTAMWMLKIGIGDIFETRDEENQPVKLQIVALLKDSVFQSEVLISDEAFRAHFPKTEGFAFFLLNPPADKQADISRVLTDALAAYGFETTPTQKRLAAYLAVQNTYLTTFQLLGGLGLLLGVLGLSVVLLRAIWERRAELALDASARLSQTGAESNRPGRERSAPGHRPRRRHSFGSCSGGPASSARRPHPLGPLEHHARSRVRCWILSSICSGGDNVARAAGSGAEGGLREA